MFIQNIFLERKNIIWLDSYEDGTKIILRNLEWYFNHSSRSPEFSTAHIKNRNKPNSWISYRTSQERKNWQYTDISSHDKLMKEPFLMKKKLSFIVYLHCIMKLVRLLEEKKGGKKQKLTSSIFRNGISTLKGINV